MARRYELKKRAERREETRRRIVEAAVELHGTVGIAATTIGQIAERAGVGRQTVYRHFPDELSLTRACSGLYWGRHPLPDPAPWAEVPEPVDRLRRGLSESYRYHRETEPMIAGALVDMADSPLLEPYQIHWQQAADVLVAPWKVRGRRRALLRAAIGHAIVFPTWQSLVRRQGLTDVEAVELMLRLTCDCESAAGGASASRG